MIKRHGLIGLLSLILVLSGTGFSRASSSNPALDPASNPPPGPDRFAVIDVEYTAFTWNMALWKGSKFACKIVIDHDGVPLEGEVYRDCGEDIYETWIEQDPCNSKNKNTCEGYYYYFVKKEPAEKEIAMDLAPATAWISLEDCEPVFSVSTNICESEPMLVIAGEEPLPNETITRIEGTYEGQPFSCNGDICKFQVPETPQEGAAVEFWAYSSYGDSSPVLTAQVRVRKADEGDPDQLYWYADVLSSQWKGTEVATCSDSWGVFPPVGGPPEWLTTPKTYEELSSDIPYTYLAANLILQGAVDASFCADGGVTNGAANQCGLDASRDAVREWQNQFDELILNTAQDTGVPARLIKNLFARESQFWPGIYQVVGDAGLGQLTENGADTTLFWNASFYDQFCPLILEADKCQKRYMNLSTEDQTALRRGLVGSVNATCENCPLGIDLSQADFSVGVFAHTMIANCEQSAQVLYNYTLQQPADLASYEDLWKFTLVNYNAGGGCLAEAVSGAYGANTTLTWDNVAPFLTGACKGAVDYVDDISR